MTMEPVFPPDYDPAPDANKYTQLLWSHLNTWIQKFVGNHHVNHEPGGKDFVEMPLGGLKDVLIYHPETAQVLGYTMSGTVPIWRNMEATALGGTITYAGGTSYGQAFFQAAGSIAPMTYPGPTNMLGTAVTITDVRIAATGDCSGNVTAGGAFSFSSGGGVTNSNDLSYSWAPGGQLSMEITAAGTACTAISVDLVFERVT